ncbi:putative mitochondrial pyruvate carrier 1 [Yarrowia sp. C11]|nr:putative mitochondrial pyruvate carrier 1 [Yarrowia sp. C11]KAG5365068.1 putative mitochondrial pyruvate carrier 1 [Yarrowia sp. E02]
MSNGSIISRTTNYIFSKDFVKYICSTHFWGPVSNFGIPVAAVMDLKKDPTKISGPMTGSLIVYSLVFMKYATAVTPWNPLLFGCHFVNECAQLGQGARYANYWWFGGREKALKDGTAAPLPEKQ